MEDILEQAKRRPADDFLTAWLPKLGLEPGIALDLGCGSGAEAEYLARQGYMVDAIDKDPVAAKYAAERCEGLKVDVIEGDFREFRFRPDYYALAVSINALPFVPKSDAGKLLGEIRTSIKPGGAALICVFGPQHAWSDREDMSFWEKGEFEELWKDWDTLSLEEHIGDWPLRSGTMVYQHRLHLAAKKPA